MEFNDIERIERSYNYLLDCSEPGCYSLEKERDQFNIVKSDNDLLHQLQVNYDIDMQNDEGYCQNMEDFYECRYRYINPKEFTTETMKEEINKGIWCEHLTLEKFSDELLSNGPVKQDSLMKVFSSLIETEELELRECNLSLVNYAMILTYFTKATILQFVSCDANVPNISSSFIPKVSMNQLESLEIISLYSKEFVSMLSRVLEQTDTLKHVILTLVETEENINDQLENFGVQGFDPYASLRQVLSNQKGLQIFKFKECPRFFNGVFNDPQFQLHDLYLSFALNGTQNRNLGKFLETQKNIKRFECTHFRCSFFGKIVNMQNVEQMILKFDHHQKDVQDFSNIAADPKFKSNRSLRDLLLNLNNAHQSDIPCIIETAVKIFPNITKLEIFKQKSDVLDVNILKPLSELKSLSNLIIHNFDLEEIAKICIPNLQYLVIVKNIGPMMHLYPLLIKHKNIKYLSFGLEFFKKAEDLDSVLDFIDLSLSINENMKFMSLSADGNLLSKLITMESVEQIIKKRTSPNREFKFVLCQHAHEKFKFSQKYGSH